mmetsp:Transcript_2346/g.1684  ORF Transcript_2346/g.1684 Transcript_2346/m.1684 type:complete len:116 (+) Transcript_2346:66-413(+)
MPVSTNIFAAAAVAPFLAILSAVVLATLQRSLDWVTYIAKNPQKGTLKQIKPFVKQLDVFFERIFAGNKFSISTTNILLMMVSILLLVLIFEGAEKPKNVRVVTTRKEKEPEKSN